MTTKYAQEELDKIYEKLPAELQEVLFSLETASTLWSIGERYNVMDERYNEIIKYVAYVLMGLMLPSEFQEVLEKEVGLPENTAKEIAREINRFVFYPVRPALEKLHSMEIGQGQEQKEGVPREMPMATETAAEEKPEQPRGPDAYREPLE